MRDISENYSNFIYKRTYSRWDWDKGRREEWEETIDRYFNFFRPRVPDKLLHSFEKAKQFVLDKKVMPSMRCLWSAGEALEKENIAGYNCSYLAINKPKAFSELMYILMNGAGAGFSVERQYVAELPAIPDELKYQTKVITFKDSKKGWSVGYQKFIDGLYAGKIFMCDLSKIRPEGSLLKTFGGRASGPEPLQRLIDFTLHTFQNAKGRKLNSLEAHDVACYVASIVVVGGVRRSACISLSNLSDLRMRDAKQGQFMDAHGHRQLANNSVAYTERPDINIFMQEWLSLMESGTGERGVFNREAATKIATANGRRQHNDDFGCNPCSEIIMRPDEFCNLSEVVVRYDDTLNDLTEKVKFATILGMLQSTLTDFNFLDESWKKNCEEERLLGVSLTGVMDHPVLSNEMKSEKIIDWLTTMKETAIKVAKKWSKAMDVNMPAAITCVKPSGCLGLDSIIKTTDGKKSMRDVFDLNGVSYDTGTYPDHSFIKPNVDIFVYDENNDIQKVTNLYINGVTDVYELEDENGNVFKFTGNHRLKTVTGWVRVDELKEGDDILSF